MMQHILQDAFWSCIAALGFAMLFSVPPRTLPGCLICGAVGHALRTFLIEQFEVTIVFGTLVGAIVVGFMGAYFAQRFRSPALIFTVPGVIPMVPGVFAYRTMLGLLSIVDLNPATGTEVLVTMSINAVTTGLILVALAAGSIAPDLLFQRPKPVV